jgi:hypothetical protein
MPMWGRTARAARLTTASARGAAIVTPFIVTCPSDGSSSSARQRNSVVLPEPLGPTTQRTSRWRTASDTRVSASWDRTRLLTSFAAMIATPGGPCATSCRFFVSAFGISAFGMPASFSHAACRHDIGALRRRRGAAAVTTLALSPRAGNALTFLRHPCLSWRAHRRLQREEAEIGAACKKRQARTNAAARMVVAALRGEAPPCP